MPGEENLFKLSSNEPLVPPNQGPVPSRNDILFSSFAGFPYQHRIPDEETKNMPNQPRTRTSVPASFHSSSSPHTAVSAPKKAHPGNYDSSTQVPREPPPSYAHTAINVVPEPQGLFPDKEFVADMSVEIQRAFIRKVYSILLAMLTCTTVTTILMKSFAEVGVWVRQNSGWVIGISVASLVVYIGLYFIRKKYPYNFLVLALFTIMQSFALGSVVLFYQTDTVLQAFLITTGIFVGLTIFTMISKIDFSGLGVFLMIGLLGLLLVNVVNLFIPFSRTVDLVVALLGAILFSAMIVFDTFLVCARYSPEEYIMAVIGLYLDFINLFLYVLRLLNALKN